VFALHTISANPASTYALMQAYRAVSRTVMDGDWDAPLPFLSQTVRAALDDHGALLLANRPARIAAPRTASYDDSSYNIVVFIDACADGWGAYVRDEKCTTMIQQRWINTLGECKAPKGGRGEYVYREVLGPH
jgi:hypothetical protein